MSDLRPESLAVSVGRPHTPGAPLNTPIVMTAPFRHSPIDNHYSRHDVTETVQSFQEVLGALEGGEALAFSSGIAAVSTVVDTLPVGTVAVVPDGQYSGTVRIFDEAERLGRLSVRRVDVADTAAVLAALPGAGLLWLESVTNPLMAVPDLPVLAGAAHTAGAIVGVDATFSTPMVVRPLEHGVDVVMHSATKYLSGHSDVLMGALVVRDADLHATLWQRRSLAGSIPGGLETFLATRGIRTLALRMERAQANAGVLAQWLAAHPRVTRVRYPGLPGDPGHEVAARIHDGFGAMIGFELSGSPEAAEAVCQALQLINHATSLGGVESLIERRARHEVDAGFGTPPNLLRLSVGIEHVGDLWDDLIQAIDSALPS
jgi:cystathionine gamma-synthase